MEIGPLKNVCRSCRADWKFSGGIFDIAGKRKRIAELDEQTAAPDFWNAADKAQTVLREQLRLKSTVDGFDAQRKAAEDVAVGIELADAPLPGIVCKARSRWRRRAGSDNANGPRRPQSLASHVRSTQVPRF